MVTERSMKLGQIIIFDNNNHKGVYNRVMTFKKIIDGAITVEELWKWKSVK